MRVIASAYHVAETENKKLVLFWKNDTGCNCSYRELFNLPENIQGIVVNGFFPKKFLKLIPIIMGKNRFFTDKDIKLWKEKNKAHEFLSKPENIYIRTCETLYKTTDEHFPPLDYTIFHPVSAISDSLPKIFDHTNLIGIHIRRTDNIASIENSPLELFMKNMDREMDENNGNCIFFIASDDSESKSLLLKRYGSKHIFTRTGIELSRAEQNGIRDAYIDLLCLSKCSKIYGSYWSSFGRCAAHIGNIPLIICKK